MVMRVESVAIHWIAAAPGNHGLRYVGQTERDGVLLLHPSHKAAVLSGGPVYQLGQAHGAVVASDIETLLV